MDISLTLTDDERHACRRAAALLRALAAGLTAIEAGSDIGSSIRNPAHYCGVYGHKPTWGICPPLGQSLNGNVAQADISVIGPLARSADDLAVAYSRVERVVLPAVLARGGDHVDVAVQQERPPAA